MPWAGNDFPNADVGEVVLLTFDFCPSLGVSETLSSASDVFLLISGTDSTPSSRLVGSPVISGETVSQLVSFVGLVLTDALPTNQYRLIMTVTTSLGQTIDSWAQITVSDPTLT